MSNFSLTACFQQAVVWTRTDRAEFPYIAEVSGQNWQIRINNFPEENLYTLLIQDKKIGNFDDWPSLWHR
ncbi:MAG: hypothetical protein BWK79_03535 [Beggiatoa sp. IS2]|nr:MAG: hypothetical protein BWK79_03535 [Beggiatoa sp. IS2]